MGARGWGKPRFASDLSNLWPFIPIMAIFSVISNQGFLAPAIRALRHAAPLHASVIRAAKLPIRSLFAIEFEESGCGKAARVKAA